MGRKNNFSKVIIKASQKIKTRTLDKNWNLNLQAQEKT